MSFPGSDFADRIEKHFPKWFRWDGGGGDFISWIHHTLWALLFTGVGALIGWPFGLAALGASIGSKVALGFYLLREGLGIREAWGTPGALWRGKPHWAGWGLDGFMDCVGPALVAIYFW